MDDKTLDRLETKIDNIVQSQNEMKITLAAQHVSLTEHMKRTEILEQTVKPLSDHDKLLLGGVKFVAYMTALGGALGALFEGVIAVLKFLHIKG